MNDLSVCPSIVKRKSHLSKSQQRLLQVFQELNFGKIQQLHVKAGEPLLTPSPRILKDLKIPGANDARVESHLKDFELKREHLEFFHHLHALGDGVLELIEVRHGLPVRLLIESTT
ncbi:MAG: hypothetical protein JNJ77_07640 [Planctomycetia bacterium]|nr:hypothetical protein [Planctomycetia bacterium]